MPALSRIVRLESLAASHWDARSSGDPVALLSDVGCSGCGEARPDAAAGYALTGGAADSADRERAGPPDALAAGSTRRIVCDNRRVVSEARVAERRGVTAYAYDACVRALRGARGAGARTRWWAQLGWQKMRSATEARRRRSDVLDVAGRRLHDRRLRPTLGSGWGRYPTRSDPRIVLAGCHGNAAGRSGLRLAALGAAGPAGGSQSMVDSAGFSISAACSRAAVSAAWSPSRPR